MNIDLEKDDEAYLLLVGSGALEVIEKWKRHFSVKQNRLFFVESRSPHIRPFDYNGKRFALMINITRTGNGIAAHNEWFFLDSNGTASYVRRFISLPRFPCNFYPTGHQRFFDFEEDLKDD